MCCDKSRAIAQRAVAFAYPSRDAVRLAMLHREGLSQSLFAESFAQVSINTQLFNMNSNF